jgi:hypothetical protein
MCCHYSVCAVTLRERAALRSDPHAQRRLLTSYQIMLDFYGMRLADETLGFVVRHSNYVQRYSNLNYSSHNYLRITRILKCLAEFGRPSLQLGFLLHIVRELTTGQLHSGVAKSAVNYWIPVLQSAEDRARLQSVMDELLAAEEGGDTDGTDATQVELTEERILQVLQEAHQQRLEMENEDAPPAPAAAAGVSATDEPAGAHASASAAASPPSRSDSRSGSPTFSDDDDSSVGSREGNRADFTSAGVASPLPSADAQTVPAAALTSARAAQPDASSSAAASNGIGGAAAPTQLAASKRKLSSSAEVDDGGRGKKPLPSPSAAAAAAAAVPPPRTD